MRSLTTASTFDWTADDSVSGDPALRLLNQSRFPSVGILSDNTSQVSHSSCLSRPAAFASVLTRGCRATGFGKGILVGCFQEHRRARSASSSSCNSLDALGVYAELKDTFSTDSQFDYPVARKRGCTVPMHFFTAAVRAQPQRIPGVTRRYRARSTVQEAVRGHTAAEIRADLTPRGGQVHPGNCTWSACSLRHSAFTAL